MTQKKGNWASFNWSDDHVNERHVQHLQHVTSMSFVERYKQRSYTLMKLEAGHHVLDIGCGLGNDVVALASMVGNAGLVIGIDQSETMIQQAKARQDTGELSVEFKVMDARQMTFGDQTFDSVRSDRVLQHIPDVHRAISEGQRVLKAGGTIVLNETDWGTLIMDVTNRDTFRKIKAHHEDHNIRNGWMGRNTIHYLSDLNFEDINVFPDTAIFRDYEFTKQWGVWHGAVQSALEANVITQAEAGEHLQDIEARAQAGKHMLSLSIFSVSATKPA